MLRPVSSGCLQSIGESTIGQPLEAFESQSGAGGMMHDGLLGLVADGVDDGKASAWTASTGRGER